MNHNLDGHLGVGIEIKGTLRFEGSVRIDGKFTGEIFSNDTLEIGPDAEIEAEIDVSTVIVAGKVGLVQYADIDRFLAGGARLRNGDTLPADLIVMATGFKGQDVLVRKLFGDDVADRVGPIWGFDAEQLELRNMFIRTGQPGLWFIAGSFAQCRIYSKYLGLQIKACEEGMIPLVRQKIPALTGF